MRVLDAIDTDEIARLRAAGEFFWLDLLAPPDEEVRRLADAFDLHPIALEDLLHFGQRPKIDDYPHYLHLVFYGVEGERPVEVHLIVHGDALVTVRRDECSTLKDAHARVEDIDPTREEYAVYRVLDALTDSFFPMLERIDDEIDDLEDRVVVRAVKSDARSRSSPLKRTLSELRRRVGPQRDLLASAGDVFDRLPGFIGRRAPTTTSATSTTTCCASTTPSSPTATCSPACSTSTSPRSPTGSTS